MFVWTTLSFCILHIIYVGVGITFLWNGRWRLINFTITLLVCSLYNGCMTFKVLSVEKENLYYNHNSTPLSERKKHFTELWLHIQRNHSSLWSRLQAFHNQMNDDDKKDDSSYCIKRKLSRSRLVEKIFLNVLRFRRFRLPGALVGTHASAM